MLALALALTALLLGASTRFAPGHADYARPWDHHKYLEMAAHGPASFHVAPFCWRVGLPLLAAILPLEPHLAFLFISFLGVSLTGFLVHRLGRELGHAPLIALSGMLLYFSAGYATRHHLHNPLAPDALSLLLITLGLVLVVQGRDLAFAATVALGVTVKECLLFLVPLRYSVRAQRVLDWPALGRALLVGLPGLIALVAVRLLIPRLNHDPSYIASLPAALSTVHVGTADYNYLDALRRVGLARLSGLSVDTLLACFVRPFGLALALLPWLALRRSARLALRLAPFLLLIYVQLLFATDTERLLAFALPALIPLSLLGLTAVARWSRAGEGPLVALGAANLALNWIRPDAFDLPLVPQLVLVGLAAAGVVVLRRLRRPAHADPML